MKFSVTNYAINLKVQKRETNSQKIWLDVIFSRFPENEVQNGIDIA